jgi:hypothetical protein
MTANQHKPSIAIEEVVTWLEQRGFSEAARTLLEVSEEVQGEIANAEYGEWLLCQRKLEEFCQNQAKLKGLYQSLEDTDDNPF